MVFRLVWIQLVQCEPELAQMAFVLRRDGADFPIDTFEEPIDLIGRLEQHLFILLRGEGIQGVVQCPFILGGVAGVDLSLR